MMEVTRTKTEGEVIWLDALIDGIRGKTGDEQGEIVGQNVKLELIRAHRGANEWPIVIVDRQARRNNPGFVLRVHLSVPHFLTTWTRRGEYWASYRKLAVIVSSKTFFNERNKLIYNMFLQCDNVTPWMICTDGTCACLACLMMYGRCSETEGSVWTQQRGEWDRQVALISGRPQHGDTRCIVLPPPLARTHALTSTLERRARWLGTNHLPRRTGAFHSSAVMYGVWLLLATSPHSHKFNTSSYRARSGSYSGTNCFECSECLSARLCTPRAKNYKGLELYLKENQYYKCWVLWCVPRAAGIKSLCLWLGFKPCQWRGFVDGTFGTAGLTLWSRLKYLNSYWMCRYVVRY